MTPEAFSVLFLYLDPGSGSLLIQLAAGFLLGAGLAVRVFWRKIKAFFTGKKEEPTPSLLDESSSEDDTLI